MLQIQKRPNAINIPHTEKDIYNKKLKRLQEQTGHIFENIKECFDFLLDSHISGEIAEKSNEIVPKSETPEPQEAAESPDNAVILSDNLEYTIEVLNRLTDFTDTIEELKDSDTAARIDFCVILAQNPPQSTPAPIELGEHELIFSLTEQPRRSKQKKKDILQEINIRRNAKFNTDESMSETLNALLFQDSTILNYDRAVYTGFYK